MLRRRPKGTRRGGEFAPSPSPDLAAAPDDGLRLADTLAAGAARKPVKLDPGLAGAHRKSRRAPAARAASIAASLARSHPLLASALAGVGMGAVAGLGVAGMLVVPAVLGAGGYAGAKAGAPIAKRIKNKLRDDYLVVRQQWASGAARAYPPDAAGQPAQAAL